MQLMEEIYKGFMTIEKMMFNRLFSLTAQFVTKEGLRKMLTQNSFTVLQVFNYVEQKY